MNSTASEDTGFRPDLIVNFTIRNRELTEGIETIALDRGNAIVFDDEEFPDENCLWISIGSPPFIYNGKIYNGYYHHSHHEIKRASKDDKFLVLIVCARSFYVDCGRPDLIGFRRRGNKTKDFLVAISSEARLEVTFKEETLVYF